MAGVWILKGEVVQRGLTREAEMSKQSKGSMAPHSQGYRGPKAESILCVATHSQCYRGPSSVWLLTVKATVGHLVCGCSQLRLLWAKGRGHPMRVSRTPADSSTGAWPLEGTVTWTCVFLLQVVNVIQLWACKAVVQAQKKHLQELDFREDPEEKQCQDSSVLGRSHRDHFI